MKRNHILITLGILWTILFSAMSFYWAMGGMVGVRSLGGSVYEMALNPDPSFATLVWFTGFVKLLGVIPLALLLVDWKKTLIEKLLYFITKFAGIFLFLYGLFNSITISLSAVGVFNFDLDNYATFWRLAFWEPFWMIGGVFYFFSIRKT